MKEGILSVVPPSELNESKGIRQCRIAINLRIEKFKDSLLQQIILL